MSNQLTNLELLKDMDKDESLTDVSVEEQQHLVGGCGYGGCGCGRGRGYYGGYGRWGGWH